MCVHITNSLNWVLHTHHQGLHLLPSKICAPALVHLKWHCTYYPPPLDYQLPWDSSFYDEQRGLCFLHRGLRLFFCTQAILSLKTRTKVSIKISLVLQQSSDIIKREAPSSWGWIAQRQKKRSVVHFRVSHCPCIEGFHCNMKGMTYQDADTTSVRGFTHSLTSIINTNCFRMKAFNVNTNLQWSCKLSS